MKILSLTLVYTPVLLLALSCGSASDGDDLDLVGKGDTRTTPEILRKPVRAPSPSLPGATFTIDLIQDLVFRYERDGWTLTTPKAHVNLDKLRAGQVNFVLSALPVGTGASPKNALDKALETMDALVTDANGQVEMVSGLDAARKAFAAGRIPMGLMVEGADVFDNRLDLVAELKKRGLAMVGLVGGRNNAFGDIAVSPRNPGGLTEKGAALVAVCRDAGIAVDLTHASPNTFWDALTTMAGKVVVSHTAVREIMDHPRNLNDLQILGLSRYGGVMGLIFNPEFLKLSGAAALDDVVAHIMHVKAIGAVGALALGTDYGGIHPPRGLEDVSRLPRLADALRAQGLSAKEISGVFGDNAARFFDEITRQYGEISLTEDQILRPVSADCESVVGAFEGSLAMSCDRYLRKPGALIPPTSKLKVRIRDMSMTPVTLELFGEPGVPWQAEGQNLEGKILFHRFVKLDDDGAGAMSLPQDRNLTRIFFSPTRASALREVVVWGRTPEAD